jgi:hypothetical protein
LPQSYPEEMPRFVLLLKNQDQPQMDALIRKHAQQQALNWSLSASRDLPFCFAQELQMELNSWIQRVNLDVTTRPYALTLQLRMLQVLFDVFSEAADSGRSGGSVRVARLVRGRDRRTIFPEF